MTQFFSLPKEIHIKSFSVIPTNSEAGNNRKPLHTRLCGALNQGATHFPKYMIAILLTSLTIACKPMTTEMTSDKQSNANIESKQSSDAMVYQAVQQKQTADPQSPLSGLDLISAQTDELGFEHLKYRQIFKGIPVWNSETIMHIDKDQKVYRVDGKILSIDPELTVIPALTAAQASQKASEALQSDGSWTSSGEELVVYPNQDRHVLAWSVVLMKGLNRKFVLVDAKSGEVLKILEGNWSLSKS